jgi:hypothetical protein
LRYHRAVQTEKLLRRLYTKLPRELRDRIYAFLVHKKRDISVSSSEFRQTSDNQKLDLPSEARIYDVDLVGAVVTREAAETYYEVNTFSIAYQEDTQCVLRLLTTDRLPIVYPALRQGSDRSQLGIKPYESIRHLKTNISIVDFQPRSWSRNQEGVTRRLNDLHSKLKSVLALVENKAPLHMDFSISSFKHYNISYRLCGDHMGPGYLEWDLLNLLEALKESIYSFIHVGGKASLKLYDDKEGYSADLIGLFHLTPLQWKEVCTFHLNVQR